MLALTVVSAGLIWQTSPTTRQRLTATYDEIRDYEPSGARTSTAERLEFWRKSIIIIADAPVLGHGTGHEASLGMPSDAVRPESAPIPLETRGQAIQSAR